MGPFFKFVLAESWGYPGMLRMPSGFKAWRLFAHGLQTLSRLLNARALSGSNPQLTFSIPRRYEEAIWVASPAAQLLSAGSGCHNGL